MKTKLIGLLLLVCGNINSQNTKTVDFFTDVKNYDLSVVLTVDSIRDDENVCFPRPQILGFIGKDYWRFHIHFISMIQNHFNPYEYFVYGKTKVKDIICPFQGILTLKAAEIFIEQDIDSIKEGYVVYDVQLFEDKKQNSTGYINGSLTSNFLIGSNNNIEYDAIMLVGDGFSNNKFIGNWTSYKTGKSKKCNWGDYRIPESSNLDVGVGGFMVDSKYKDNGWENLYYLQNNSFYPNCESAEYKIVSDRENEKWWLK
jgi:hypothetical protein